MNWLLLELIAFILLCVGIGVYLYRKGVKSAGLDQENGALREAARINRETRQAEVVLDDNLVQRRVAVREFLRASTQKAGGGEGGGAG